MLLGLAAMRARSLGSRRRPVSRGVFGWSLSLGKLGNMVVAGVGRRCGLLLLLGVVTEASYWICF